MKAMNVDPPRWRDGSGDPGGLGARAADLVEAVRDVPPLAPEALARIRAEVLAREPARPRRRLPLVLRFGLLAVLLLASVATARATMTFWRRHVTSVAPKTTVHPRSVAPARPAREAAPVPPPAAAPRAPAVRASTPHTRRVAVSAPPPAPVAKETAPPESEAQLLARALSRLRQAHDPAGAIALLEQYARAFPHGVLEAEAASARLEAALELDDRKTALRLLDGRSAFAGRLGAQQLLTRAELRASAGRYAEALGDFDRLLAPRVDAVAADLERALYGRAVCLGRMGRDDRARADLTTYAERYPHGKHAAEVARLLAGARPDRRP